MKKAILGLILAGVTLVGCGGGTSTLEGSIVPNTYRGNWGGTWQSQSFDDSGTITMSVYADGSITGTMTRKDGSSGPFNGTMQNDGVFRGLAGFGVGGNYDIVGSVVKLHDSLLGSFNYRYLGTVYSASMTLEDGNSSSTSGG